MGTPGVGSCRSESRPGPGRDDPPLGTVEVFDRGLPTLQALWATSLVNLRALLRLLGANPANTILGGDPVGRGAPAVTADDSPDQAVNLLGRLLSHEDPLPLERPFQGSLCLKVEVPALLSFFQLLSYLVLKVMLELVVVHGAKEVPAGLAAAWGLPSPALGQRHCAGWGETRASYGGWDDRSKHRGVLATKAKHTVAMVGQAGLGSAVRQPRGD